MKMAKRIAKQANPFSQSRFQRAFTLIEIMISITLLAALITLSYYGLTKLQREVSSSYASNETETAIAQLIEEILKLGRSANACLKCPDDALCADHVSGMSKVSPYAPLYTALQCNPTTGGTVRYVMDVNATSLRMEVSNDNGVTWVSPPRLIFGGGAKYDIKNFVLCSTAEMIVSPSSCTLIPIGLSSAYKQAIDSAAAKSPAVDLKNRFFRFQIIAKDAQRTSPFQVQSTFFVRNPAPDGMEYINGGN